MTHGHAQKFQKMVLEDAELRQKLKDIDLLPPVMRLQAAVTIAEGEGFSLDSPDAEMILAALEHRPRDRAIPAEPLRCRPA